MITVYRLWRKTGAYNYEPYGQHNTREAAMAAAGNPDMDVWRPVDDRLVLTEGADYAISPRRIAENDADRIELAVNLALSYGQIDGDHHKTWVIDQMLRVLTGNGYEQTIVDYCDGEDGPDTYSWDEGIAP